MKPFSDSALQPFGNHLICCRARNWPTLEELTDSTTGLPIFILSIAVVFTSIGYAGLHAFAAFANNNLFPTSLEESLWGLSCLALIVYCILFMCIWQVVAKRMEHAKGSWNAEASVALLKWKSWYKAKIKRSKLWRISSPLLRILILLIYISCRAFIIIESFISLRHVPLELYRTPSITYLGFIPHVQ